ncbi:DUF4041 domain-containing protein [Exiguobacterium sp. s191]|uniref:DUF4041 domain-containing protein n=1 Tax=Exiguobacterium sp. s191 TaxID=2751196 RepID=UPI001BE75D84|nr:DUF4041 domain-containing protein [Exiguobacterium sp. s191]
MWFNDWLNASKNRKEVERLTKELELIQLSKEELEYLDVKRELELIREQFAKEKTDLEEEHLKLGIKLENEHMSQRENLKKKFEAEKQDLLESNKKLKALKLELGEYEDRHLMHEHGLYEPTFEFDTSDGYKNMLTTIRSEQKEMIRKKIATDHPNQYFVDGDKKRGKEFVNDTIKLSLRAFNNECDVIVSNVKSTNLEKSHANIEKAFKQINSLTDMQTISIRRQYLQSKLRELHLKHELEVKKQEEKEEQRVIKERIREEARVLKEIENARKKVEKEEFHFRSAVTSVRAKLEEADNSEKQALLSKLAELEAKLAEVELIKDDIENREKNTRAGYVYVISNIGSFGEHVYKIGMTRRLEPLDRIRELGSASVPFTFDIHAMVFSEDAPTLENKLHHRFATKRVNQVNLRKEFFKVEIEQIAKVIKEEFDETLEITLAAQAEDYYRTLQLRESAIINL